MNYSLESAEIRLFFEKIKGLIIPSESNNYKSRFLQSNILLYIVVLLVVLKITATLVSLNLPLNIFFADITKSSLENYINQTRQSLGLRPLTNNAKLDQAAQMKAQNMVQYNYFNHTSPSGITPWAWFLKAGYNYKYAGENLAIGFFESEEVYNAWLNSPSHKANIVNPNYTEVGTAVLKGFGQNNSVVVVQEFGSPQPVKAIAKTQPKTNPKITEPVITPSPSKILPEQNLEGQAVSEKVLSQTTQSQSSLEPVGANAGSGLPAKVLNSVMYNYDGILQNIIYGVSLVLIGILLILIFFSFDVSFNKQLILRAVLIIALLSATTLLNKETIIALIPHQVLI